VPVLTEAERARLPLDPLLAAVVERARSELREVDPLGALLLGDRGLGLPDGSWEAEADERDRLQRLLAMVQAVPEPADVDDQVDRLALLFGLRRAIPAEGTRAPTGAIVLERQLLARLAPLARYPLSHAPEVIEVVEHAPAFLARSREGCLGGPAPAGEVALAAAKRLPALIEVLAAAVNIPDMRTRLEAALGPMLAAAAEDSGWILKQYLPAASAPAPREDIVDGAVSLGLGAGLEDLEAAAEAALAEQAAIAYEEPIKHDDPVEPHRKHWSADAVARRWESIEPIADAWCPAPVGTACEVEAAPVWLVPLLPPLALVNPGPLSQRPFRLLVGTRLWGTDTDVDGGLLSSYLLEWLPAAWQRAGTRLARLLLPATDAVSGWQNVARAQAPGLGAWREVDARRELAWRSILALVATGFVRGRLDLDEGASLVAAETGMEPETARLQAAHVATQPVAALALVAGKRVMDALMPRLGALSDPATARARLLHAGPIPAGSIEIGGGYTR
jgi:hypothetical protein